MTSLSPGWKWGSYGRELPYDHFSLQTDIPSRGAQSVPPPEVPHWTDSLQHVPPDVGYFGGRGAWPHDEAEMRPPSKRPARKLRMRPDNSPLQRHSCSFLTPPQAQSRAPPAHSVHRDAQGARQPAVSDSSHRQQILQSSTAANKGATHLRRKPRPRDICLLQALEEILTPNANTKGGAKTIASSLDTEATSTPSFPLL